MTAISIPSPVPMSCIRKSLKGWNRRLPSAGGTVKVPPFNLAPTGAVTMLRDMAGRTADTVE